MADFTSKRYLTRGIEADINIGLQAIMWGMIDRDIENGLVLDYLQVFTLQVVTQNGQKMQEITQEQEQPQRQKTVLIRLLEFQPVTAKVFVIDSIDYTTMLLASEY